MLHKITTTKNILGAFLVLIIAVASINPIIVTAKQEGEIANNCTFTGNSNDYCNASDGTSNLRVQNCKPGATDCGYDSPTVPIVAP